MFTHERVESQRRKGVLTDFEVVYSPGQSRKKKAGMIMSQDPWISGYGKSAAIMVMCQRICINISLTHLEEVGGS